MGRFLPYIFVAFAVLSCVQVIRGRRPGESWFAPNRRWWLLSAVIFTVLALLLLRILRV